MSRPPESVRELRQQVTEELHACIGCNECLLACPALAAPLSVAQLNAETLWGPISLPVARFARACYQCGACTAPEVCPAGLHRDAMMLYLKVRLLTARGEEEERCPTMALNQTGKTHIT